MCHNLHVPTLFLVGWILPNTNAESFSGCKTGFLPTNQTYFIYSKAVLNCLNLEIPKWYKGVSGLPSSFTIKQTDSSFEIFHTSEIRIFPPFGRWPDINKPYFKLSPSFLKNHDSVAPLNIVFEDTSAKRLFSWAKYEGIRVVLTIVRFCTDMWISWYGYDSEFKIIFVNSHCMSQANDCSLFTSLVPFLVQGTCWSLYGILFRKIVGHNMNTCFFFFIRTNFIRTPRLRFAQKLRTS